MLQTFKALGWARARSLLLHAAGLDLGRLVLCRLSCFTMACLLFFQRAGFDLPWSAALRECGLSTLSCWVPSHDRQMLEPQQTTCASLQGDKQDRGHLASSLLQLTEHLGNKHSVAWLCSKPWPPLFETSSH